MLSELPKLFDRDFVVAYFLPAAIFVAATVWLVTGFGLFPGLLPLIKTDLQGITTLGLISWFGGVLLMALNFHIYRLLEGYNDYNPFRLFKGGQVSRYRQLLKQIEDASEELRDAKARGEDAEVFDKLGQRLTSLNTQRAEHFPNGESWLLPTRFGNTIRAFEEYPYTMYGADAIVVWVRLIGVIPKEFRDLIESARAQTDFWVNLRLVSSLLFVEYFAVLLYTRQLGRLWFPVVALALAWFATANSITAARNWGDFIKSAYDLYLPDLRAKLQLPPPTSVEAERKLWTKFSQQVLYHLPESVSPRVPAQPASGAQQSAPAQSAQAARSNQ